MNVLIVEQKGGYRMFKKILYPTDFSPYSNKIVDCLIGLKTAGIHEVIILHVLDKRIFAQFPEVSIDVIKAMRESAEENLNKLEGKLQDAGIKVEKRIEMGVPYNLIVGIAKAEAVSMIIMGSHGRSLIEEMLLGSTTENVLRHATVPLLIEKFDVKKKGDEVVCRHTHKNPFEKVLFPTDFSECAKSVLPYIKQLKNAGTKEVVVAHIQDMSKIAPHLLDRLPEFEEIDTGRLSEIKNELINSGMGKVKTVLREGIPFTEVESICREENVGMIIMGSHGKGMVKEMLLGSVSGRIVRRSKSPVIIIRRK